MLPEGIRLLRFNRILYPGATYIGRGIGIILYVALWFFSSLMFSTLWEDGRVVALVSFWTAFALFTWLISTREGLGGPAEYVVWDPVTKRIVAMVEKGEDIWLFRFSSLFSSLLRGKEIVWFSDVAIRVPPKSMITHNAGLSVFGVYPEGRIVLKHTLPDHYAVVSYESVSVTRYRDVGFVHHESGYEPRHSVVRLEATIMTVEDPLRSQIVRLDLGGNIKGELHSWLDMVLGQVAREMASPVAPAELRSEVEGRTKKRWAGDVVVTEVQVLEPSLPAEQE